MMSDGASGAATALWAENQSMPVADCSTLPVERFYSTTLE